MEITKQIKVKRNVCLGLNSIKMLGIAICSNIIRTGSIINKDVPRVCAYARVSAKYIKSIDEYFLKVQEEALNIGHLNSIEKDRKLKPTFNLR